MYDSTLLLLLKSLRFCLLAKNENPKKGTVLFHFLWWCRDGLCTLEGTMWDHHSIFASKLMWCKQLQSLIAWISVVLLFKVLFWFFIKKSELFPVIFKNTKKEQIIQNLKKSPFAVFFFFPPPPPPPPRPPPPPPCTKYYCSSNILGALNYMIRNVWVLSKKYSACHPDFYHSYLPLLVSLPSFLSHTRVWKCHLKL